MYLLAFACIWEAYLFQGVVPTFFRGVFRTFSGYFSGQVVVDFVGFLLNADLSDYCSNEEEHDLDLYRDPGGAETTILVKIRGFENPMGAETTIWVNIRGFEGPGVAETTILDKH